MNAVLAPSHPVNDVSVDFRIAKFESDLGHVKKGVAQISENVSKLQEGLAAANKATADLRTDLAVAKVELGARIKDEVEGLRKENQAEFKKLREEISGVRQELGNEINSVRRELGDKISGVHQELGNEISSVRQEISAIKATLPHFATSAQLSQAVHRLESQMIRWFIYTGLGAGSLAFTAAKFLN